MHVSVQEHSSDLQITHVSLWVSTVRSSGGAAASLSSAGTPLHVMTEEGFVESRCSHRPQALLAYHSDGGRGPPLSETLLFCSAGALRSLPRWSPCRCQLTAGLYAAGRRLWLRCDTTEGTTFQVLI